MMSLIAVISLLPLPQCKGINLDVAMNITAFFYIFFIAFAVRYLYNGYKTMLDSPDYMPEHTS